MSSLVAFASIAPATPLLAPVHTGAKSFQDARKWTPEQGARTAGGMSAIVSAAVGALAARAAAKRRTRAVQRRAAEDSTDVDEETAPPPSTPTVEAPKAEALAEETAPPPTTAPPSSSPASVPFDPTGELGAMEPMGYWDPLHIMREGFKNPEGEWKSKEYFIQYRTAELKHGRIAMLAMLGLFVGTFWKFPGFEGTPGGVEGLYGAGGAGLGAVLLIAGLVELEYWKQDPEKEIGDYGWDPLGLLTMPDEKGTGTLCTYDLDMRSRELNNGRLAMTAFAISMFQEYSGFSSEEQFKFQAVDGWVAPALLMVVFVLVNSKQFYVADDASTQEPYYLSEGYKSKQLAA